MTEVTVPEEPAVERYYSTETVARLFEVTVPTVRLWIKDGKIGGGKFGTQFRIPESEVKRFALENYKPANGKYPS